MILQNGKRIDGCSDTVPIGTLQPFVGLVPPVGYLVCQGQLVSKTIYPALYEMCGNRFGTGTDKEFRLPDLRGRTIAGYDASNINVNTIGKLLGVESHKHTTGNHTLTVEEMPSHSHGMTLPSSWMNGYYHGETRWGFNADDTTSNPNRILATGGSQAHNHGDTGTTTNYQPTMVMNWIIKAVMLIPDYFVVENTLDSDSPCDALSAAQGKILNEKFADYATKSDMIQYLPLSGATLTGTLKLPTNKYFNDSMCGLDCSNSDVVNINGLYWGDLSDSQDEGIHFMRSNGNWDTLRASDGVLYFHSDRAVNQSTTSCRVNVDYKPGDTYYVKCPQANMIGGLGGTLSNSNTEVRFLLLLPRSLVNIKSVTVNTLKLNIRHPDGGYIGPSSAVDNGYDFLANYPIYVHLMGENMLNICIKNTNGWGYTNNTPLSIEPNEIKLTFA